MSESRWTRVRDNTVPVLLGTLIVAMFYSTASTHGRMADMENRLGERINALSDRVNGVDKDLSDRINGLEQRLSDRITRLETLMEIHLEAHSTQAAPGGLR